MSPGGCYSCRVRVSAAAMSPGDVNPGVGDDDKCPIALNLRNLVEVAPLSGRTLNGPGVASLEATPSNCALSF